MNNGNGTTMDDRWRKTRQALDELRAESQAKARRAVRITNNYAHDHPWRMVTTAAALALVAGLLIRGGAKKPKVVVNQPAGSKPGKSTGSNPGFRLRKVKAKSSGPSPIWEAVHALAPLILFGVKTWQSSRSNGPEPAPAPKTEPVGAPAPA